MWSLSRLVVLVLVSALTLTSQELARARGHGIASGTMVLCIGGTMQVVPMGPDGQPAGPAHVCPDGVLAIASPPVDARIAPRTETLVAFEPLPTVAAAVISGFRPVPQARGPPASV